ncbi:hypothetical protein PR048_012919 [Dryococelus australis]|uniref:Uncharacterized protein n=1 Tax=Dryococelus australis TaxID=614101 RepID=A0ABQ9HQS1_9NEOP|nr:hypothetical protein PR048_012919 [Dryococelus australis]
MEKKTSVTLNLPPKLSLEGNVHNNWIRFKYNFHVYIGASSKIFVNVADEDAIDFAATFGLKDVEMNNYDQLMKDFDSYAAYVFNQSSQNEGEIFNHSLTEAKKCIKSCE